MAYTCIRTCHEHVYLWDYDGTSLLIKKCLKEDINKRNYKFNWNWGNGLGEVIVEILGMSGLKAPFGYRVATDANLVRRLHPLCTDDKLSVQFLVSGVLARSINVFQFEHSARPKSSPILDYIVSIDKPVISGDFVHIDVLVKSSTPKNELVSWYNKNRQEIFKLLYEKYSSDKRSLIPFSYYDLGAITVRNNGSLHFVFEVKKKLQNIIQADDEKGNFNNS